MSKTGKVRTLSQDVHSLAGDQAEFGGFFMNSTRLGISHTYKSKTKFRPESWKSFAFAPWKTPLENAKTRKYKARACGSWWTQPARLEH